jgi:predicted DNA-binding transcriptional regulator AlpA
MQKDNSPNTEPHVTFLTQIDLATMLKTTRPTIHQLVKAGKLPPPIRLGTRLLRWRFQDVLACLTSLQSNTPA